MGSFAIRTLLAGLVVLLTAPAAFLLYALHPALWTLAISCSVCALIIFGVGACVWDDYHTTKKARRGCATRRG